MHYKIHTEKQIVKFHSFLFTFDLILVFMHITVFSNNRLKCNLLQIELPQGNRVAFEWARMINHLLERNSIVLREVG